MWGIQKVAVIKLNSIMMLLGQKCVSEFVLVLDNFYQFLLLHLAPLLWSSSSLFAFYIGDFGWAAPLWLPWPWISEGEKELLRIQMRSSRLNFPFGLLVLITVLISCASSKLLFKFCKKLSSNDKSSLVTKDGSKEDGGEAVQHEGQCLEPQSHPLHPCVRNSDIQ